MDTVKVVCGIILQNQKVFICRRKKGKSLEGFWEFPGGKVEDNESYKDSLTRELQEELDMSVEVVEQFKTVIHEYDQFTIELISFICAYKACTYTLSDHDKYEWTSIENLQNKKLAPADIPIAEMLLRKKERYE